MHVRDLKILSLNPGDTIFYSTKEGVIKREMALLDPKSPEYKQLQNISSDRDPALPIAAELAFINWTGDDLNKRLYHFKDVLTGKKWVYAADIDDYHSRRHSSDESLMEPENIFFQRERCMEYCQAQSGVNKEVINEFIDVLEKSKMQVKAIETVYNTVKDNAEKYRIITEILSSEELPEKYKCYI